MNWKKRKFLLQSTENGQVGWIAGYWFLVFLALLLCACTQLAIYKSSVHYIEDGLAASNLAASVMDVVTYGKTGEIIIDDETAAYDRFCDALKANLNLDENWKSNNSERIRGAVQVEEVIIYCVQNRTIHASIYRQGTYVGKMDYPLGSVSAPNGKIIESTGIYSRVSCKVKGYLGAELAICREQLSDIVCNEEG